LKSMDARDQRDRQQFHEAKVFDTVQAQAVTYWLGARPDSHRDGRLSQSSRLMRPLRG
jgi:hypothetical protein